MRPSAAFLTLVIVATPIAAFSCGSKNDPPPATGTATATATYPPPPNTGYPPPTNTAYYPPPTNTAYPPPTNTAYPPPTNTAYPPPTATATMSPPGPLALPCQNDAACFTHRCNMQYQKCAAPCQGPQDCNPGNNCMMGVCAPKAPGQP
ncbi:MAG: hypothetical protein JNL38_16040 [Myxococcales bacterium]|nr:hypothetical protein [Myxococcales bacterium]